MGRLWEENRKLFTFLGVFLGLWLVINAVLHSTVTSEAGRLEGKLAEQKTDLKKYFSGSDNFANVKRRYAEAVAELEKQFKDLKERLGINVAKSYIVPPKHSDPALYFRDVYENKQREIAQYCRVLKNVLLSPSAEKLGVDVRKKLDNKTAQEDLNKLAVAEKVIKLAANCEVFSINSIALSNPEFKGAKKPKPPARADGKPEAIEYYPEFIKEFPVEISFTADIEALMRFLQKMRDKDQFLVLRKISVSPSKDEGAKRRLDVTMSIAGMIFPTGNELEAIIKTSPKKEIKVYKPKGV